VAYSKASSLDPNTTNFPLLSSLTSISAPVVSVIRLLFFPLVEYVLQSDFDLCAHISTEMERGPEITDSIMSKISHSSILALHDCFLGNFNWQSLNFQIKLNASYSISCSRTCKIHVPKMIFCTYNVGQNYLFCDIPLSVIVGY